MSVYPSIDVIDFEDRDSSEPGGVSVIGAKTLTPKQARVFAARLLKAADKAESYVGKKPKKIKIKGLYTYKEYVESCSGF